MDTSIFMAMVFQIISVFNSAHTCDYVNECYQTYHRYLFRSTPGSTGPSQRPGVWGGELCLENNGNSSDLQTHGFDSLELDPSATGSGVYMNHLSYDTEAFILLTVSKTPSKYPDAVRYTLTTSYLCKANQERFLGIETDFILINDEQPYFMDPDCGFRCGLGPFAMLGERIFFVLSAVYGQRLDQLEREIHLRELTSCSISGRDEPEAASFDPYACSRLVAVISKQAYKKPNPSITQWTTKSLKVSRFNQMLHFFIQVFDTSDTKSPQLKLIHVVEHQAPEVIHSEPINGFYVSRNLDVDFIGSLDVEENYVCWSATTKILCGHFQIAAGGNGTIQKETFRPAIVLESDEASHVCHTDLTDANELHDVFTGIAIADAHDSLSIYFGCYSKPNIGGLGVGLLRIRHHGTVKDVLPVTSVSNRVFGSGLFVTDHLGYGCPVGHEYTSGVFSQEAHNDNGPTSSSQGTVVGRVEFRVILMLSVLLFGTSISYDGW